jgi:hypothetical protein
MRTPIALALFVSLTAGSFAQNPLNVNEVSSALHSAWNTAREAGLEANGRQSYSEALDAFEQCWAKPAVRKNKARRHTTWARCYGGSGVSARPGRGWNALTISGAPIQSQAPNSRWRRRAFPTSSEAREIMRVPNACCEKL